MGWWQTGWSVSGGLAVLALAASASADQPGFELDYVADAGCVAEQGFRALVQRQLVDYDPDAVARTRAHVVARIVSSEQSYVARFELLRGDGTRSSRELTAATCAEAAPALAFVLALALGGRDAEAEPSSEAKPAEPVQPAPLQLSAARATTPAKPPAPAQASSRWRYGLGVELGAHGGLGPVLATTESAFAELERKDSVWPWQSRLALIRDQPVTRADISGSLRLSWLALRLAECPVAVAASSTVRLLPCVVAHAGRMTALGDPAPAPGAAGRQVSKAWVDAGLGLRLELRLLGPLSLQIQAEGLAPLTRYRFEFAPTTAIYDVPGLAAAGSVGLGAVFP
jgi:hypothetical protein